VLSAPPSPLQQLLCLGVMQSSACRAIFILLQPLTVATPCDAVQDGLGHDAQHYDLLVLKGKVGIAIPTLAHGHAHTAIHQSLSTLQAGSDTRRSCVWGGMVLRATGAFRGYFVCGIRVSIQAGSECRWKARDRLAGAVRAVQ